MLTQNRKDVYFVSQLHRPRDPFLLELVADKMCTKYFSWKER